jgi:hypothetical protein
VTEKADLAGNLGERFRRWLLAERIERVQGPYERESKERQQPWWKVVCLTGVDFRIHTRHRGPGGWGALSDS